MGGASLENPRQCRNK
ncbi:hypothetical protein F383_27612 [Gossypium arboreum]|uniref:Uncharacterized protein n=1 Tax=Gossypium arboreum TaxID=29729 RepID=A0A0B0MWA0_GOSAR|nr:hypothetical protein F383_27612 [Gossypium arboreum]